MRDVNDSKRDRPPATGGWLHLDVSRGASGAMIAGALLDLGLDERVVREAFDDAGLSEVGLRVTPLARDGVSGLRVEITDAAGRPLSSEPELARRERARVGRSVRRRLQQPRLDVRPAPAPKAMGIAQGEGRSSLEEDDDDDDDGGQQQREGARVISLGGEVVPSPPAPDEGPKRGAVSEWLRGSTTSADALLSFVTASGLPPLVKGLALKVSRRALTARAHVEGAPLADVHLGGVEAVLLVAETIACAALVAALGPARVSASATLLDSEAAPWVEEVLSGVRVREEDVGFSPTTPIGAAIVAALAFRSGARGEVTLGLAGTGFGPGSRRGRPHVSRALYASDAAVATRGEGQAVAVTRLEALVDGGGRAALLPALRTAGAGAITTATVIDDEGDVRLRVVCTASREREAEVVRALLAHDAPEVLLSTAEVRRPEDREVTVSVGRANKERGSGGEPEDP